MAQTKTQETVKVLFPFTENEDTLDDIAKCYPVYAYPEYGYIIFDGHPLDLAEVEKVFINPTIW